MKILVPGSFDIFHAGHLQFLQYLHQFGDLYIALGGDEYQTEYKRKPVQTWQQRASMLARLDIVAGVLYRKRKSLEGFFQTYDFDAIGVGSDWVDQGIGTFLRLCGITPYYCAKNNIAVIVAPNPGYFSTTKIIDQVLKNASIGDG